MDIQEYNKVKSFDYVTLCDYLKNKYGEAKYNYLTANYNYVAKVSRTSDGLYCHHICEDRAILLSDPSYAKNYPYEYQHKDNLVYCDFLEHLLLHILIAGGNKCAFINRHYVGLSGIFDFIVPELNDVYSGWVTIQEWRKNCHNRIACDVDVYCELLKRIIYSNKIQERIAIMIKKDYIDPDGVKLLLKRSMLKSYGKECDFDCTYIFEKIDNL